MTARIDHPVVKAAIDALNAHDKTAWNALLAPGATFSDDGHEGSLARSTEGAFGKGREHFTSVESGGLHVYGRYRSETWCEFTTFFKFQIAEGRITRLEVGQADR